MILTSNDFTGRYEISVGYGSKKLDELIEERVPFIIAELLGAEFAVEFLEQVEDDTLTPENEKIFNELIFNIEYFCARVLYKSQGVKKMLLNILYSEYQEMIGTPTSLGKIKTKTEGGELVTDNYTDRFRYYNDGISTYRAIQAYIKDNIEDYPLFKGIEKETRWLI